MFAKLYGGGENQVLVRLGEDCDGNPEIRFQFNLVDRSTVERALTFPVDKNEKGAAKSAARAIFQNITEATAYLVANVFRKQLESKEPEE